MEKEKIGTEKKTVTILLTKYSSWFGRFICAISKNGYSHASISIDDAEEIFTALTIKGLLLRNLKSIFPEKECWEESASVCRCRRKPIC